jgi:hypothetical protein
LLFSFRQLVVHQREEFLGQRRTEPYRAFVVSASGRNQVDDLSYGLRQVDITLDAWSRNIWDQWERGLLACDPSADNRCI